MKSLLDVPAPAKLNLFLHVVGRRDDGYHLLQSLFVLIDWHDTLHFQLRHDSALHRQDLGATLPADDLCLRAARLLQRASGTTLGADLSIDKQVPSGAGMGGGSSDAATTLLALNRLWQLRWPRRRLLDLALQLGADVPFFVGGHHALIEGIGERMTPLRMPQQWFAVVKPPRGTDTGAIFASPSVVRNTRAAILSGFLVDAPIDPESGSTQAALIDVNKTAWGRNDLQAAAQEQCPEVAQAAQWLHERFGNSRMTGSGSAVFARAGAGEQPMAMSSTADPFQALSNGLPPGWVARLCRSLDAHPLVNWAD